MHKEGSRTQTLCDVQSWAHIRFPQAVAKGNNASAQAITYEAMKGNVGIIMCVWGVSCVGLALNPRRRQRMSIR